MSKKASQGERPWPSTQQMLLDYLLRIVEGEAYEDFGDPFKDEWMDEKHRLAKKHSVNSARGDLRLSRMIVEARDRPSSPRNQGFCHGLLSGTISRPGMDHPKEAFDRHHVVSLPSWSDPHKAPELGA